MNRGKWTEEQWEAITDRGANLLVAAAAGAGKTAVLVERIIRHLTHEAEPVDVDRLLVVTFTNAAAAEMRDRVAAALVQALNACPHSAHVERQLALLQRASITTLHAFCLDLLRQYFYRLNLDPHFRIADETEVELLRLEVLEELFESYYDKPANEAFTNLVECYGGERDDLKLQQLVLKLDLFAKSQPFPELWLHHLSASFKLPGHAAFDEMIWARFLKEGVSLELDKALCLLTRALKLCRLPGGPVEYEGVLAADLAMLHQLKAANSGSWLQMSWAIQAVQFNKLPAGRPERVETLKKQVMDLRDEVKKGLNQLSTTYFSRQPAEYVQELQEIQPLVEALCGIVLDFQQAYRQAKMKRCLVDFNDLEHYCLALLTDPASAPGQPVPSALALELQDKYIEVLVDEYQDINAVQETILQLLARQNKRRNLFMVGDVKQSIYRFRLAEPGLFLSKYDTYPDRKGEKDRRIDLAKNFRSRKEIIEATNFVFRQLMTERVGGVIYDRQAELVLGADYPQAGGDGELNPYVTEVHLIDRKGQLSAPDQQSATNSEEEPEEELDAVELEARVIGRRILQMLDSSNEKALTVYEQKNKSCRQVQYRDIVVLLRSVKNSAAIYLEQFRRLGIPAYAELGGGYFAATEVETMLALLKIIDNPRQDIYLAAVLRSPLLGLTAEELGEIRLASQPGDFYEALKAACLGCSNDGLRAKLQGFFKDLERWRTIARRDTLPNLIWTLYRETGFYDFAGGLPGGAQRQANLRALHDRAKQFEKTSYRGLFRFLRFLERLQDSGGDLGAARALGENENVVRIMSIHKSKGLEFPIVFVGGLGKQFNVQELHDDMLIHRELGLGPNIINPQTRLVYPSLAKLAVRLCLKQELLAEELRVLYVAMTRAREKLVLVGSVKDLAKAAGQWSQFVAFEDWPLPAASLSAAKNYLDWLCAALARHQAGQTVRELSLCAEQPPPAIACASAQWEIKIWEQNTIKYPGEKEENRDQRWQHVKLLEPIPAAGCSGDLLLKRLNWTYPYAEATGIAAKVAVSDLTAKVPYRSLETEGLFTRQQVLERPKFLQELQGLSAAEKGTAWHLVMQHLDLTRQPSALELRAFLQELRDREIITSQQMEAIEPAKITSFFTSELGVKLRSARRVYQEMPFSLILPVAELHPHLPGCEEQVLVQGVIDCFFEAGDGFVLVDFKTDRVKPEMLPAAAAAYRPQLDLYARAIEQILHRPVQERYIYFFAAGQAVKLD